MNLVLVFTWGAAMALAARVRRTKGVIVKIARVSQSWGGQRQQHPHILLLVMTLSTTPSFCPPPAPICHNHSHDHPVYDSKTCLHLLQESTVDYWLSASPAPLYSSPIGQTGTSLPHP